MKKFYKELKTKRHFRKCLKEIKVAQNEIRFYKTMKMQDTNLKEVNKITLTPLATQSSLHLLKKLLKGLRLNHSLKFKKLAG